MRPELLVATPNANEATILWIDQKLRVGIVMGWGSGGMNKASQDQA